MYKFQNEQEMLDYFGYDSEEFDKKYTERIVLLGKARANYLDYKYNKINKHTHAVRRGILLNQIENNRAWFAPEQQKWMEQTDYQYNWSHRGTVNISA